MNPTDALAYIRGKLRDWAQVPVRINAQIQRGSQLAYAAQQRGDVRARDNALTSMQQLGALLQLERATTGRLRGWLEDLAGAGETLGVVPLVLALAGVALAAGMALVYKKLALEKQKLDDVEKGILPASAITPPTGGIGGAIGEGFGRVVLPVALGLGALWVGKQVLDRATTARGSR